VVVEGGILERNCQRRLAFRCSASDAVRQDNLFAI
jgi:hypothetical protein